MNAVMFSEVMKELPALINEADLHLSQVITARPVVSMYATFMGCFLYIQCIPRLMHLASTLLCCYLGWRDKKKVPKMVMVI